MYSRERVGPFSKQTGPFARLAAGVAAVAIGAAAVAQVSGQSPGMRERVAACAVSAAPAPCLIDAAPAGELEAALFADAELAASLLPRLGDALMATPPAATASDEPLATYIIDASRARTRRLSARGTWSDAEGEMALRLQLVDAERFVTDEAFRARVLALLPRAFDPTASPALRDQLLYSIATLPGVDFAASEAIEIGWGAIARRALPRARPYEAGALTFTDDVTGRIAASVFSLPGPFLDPDGVARFMTALGRARQGRDLIALTDLPMRTALAAAARESGFTLIETHGRELSPWPRDPFSVVRREDGGVAFLVRPNTQRQRMADNDMPLEVIQGLPDRLDAAWGEPAWVRSPVRFHNGQVLMMPDAAWVTVHSVSARALERLGWTSAPPEGADQDVWRAFRQAVLDAASDLAALYGRPVKFVHAMPETIAPGVVDGLAAGGGFDLDSLVTLVPQRDGRLAALVGDVERGRALLAGTTPTDLAGFRATWGLATEGHALRDDLIATQSAPRAAGVARFLDGIAAHLTGEGMRVERVPLFFVPVASLADHAHLQHDDFLITWNNVVFETVDGRVRAEGFASGLPAGDAIARDAFARAGVTMDYLPPLVESVILNGGYRCASQHVREPR